LLTCGNPAQLQSEKGYVVSVAAGVSNDAEVMIGMKLMIQHKSSPAQTTLCCNYRSMQKSWECITSMMHSRHCGPSDYSTSKTQVQDVCNNFTSTFSQFVLQEDEKLIGILRCKL